MNRSVLTLTALLSLSACTTIGPNYLAPDTSPTNDWATQQADYFSQQTIASQWWTIFDDNLLSHYIEQAIHHNKDVTIALANLRQARALHRETRALFLPQIGSETELERSQTSDSSSDSSSGSTRNLYDVNLDASWEIDIFGGNAREAEAASARIDSAEADYQGVVLSTLSEVARLYFEARGLQKRIRITKENAHLQQQTFGVVQARLDVGEASQFDLTRAQGEYQLTLAKIPNLEADLYAAIYSLSVLLGQAPEALLNDMLAAKPLPPVPDIVPVGLRSELLQRRPDIRSAERELAASIADIGAEEANLYPKFFLTGESGFQARRFSDLFTAAGSIWSFSTLMQWSIFEGGAIRARIDAEQAESEAALALYEKTVLNALSEAETALVRYGRELETRQRLHDGVQSRRQSVKLAKALFDVGETDYLAVLDAERELTASEDDLVLSETQQITKLITLYTVLGGGWEVAEQLAE